MPDEQNNPVATPSGSSGNGQVGTPAQAAQAALSDKGGSGSEPYFSWKYPDGKEEVFKTKDELSKAWRDSYLGKSDLTRKQMAIGEERRKHEEERKKFQEEQKAFLESRKRYDQWDQMLKTRPDIMSQLERAASSPATPDAVFDRTKGYVDENTQKLQERLEAMEQKLEKERSEKELQATFQAMKEKYPDFDEGAVMERLEYLQDGKTEPLVELLHWAAKGQMAPAQMEEKITENLAKKSQARMVPAGGATVKAPPKQYKSLDEAKEAAYREELGIEIGG